MGFGGSTSGANVSLKNNRRERKSKVSKFQKTTGSKIGAINKEQNLSPEELEILRIKISTENNKRQQKILIITALSVILILSVIGFFMFKKPF